MTLNAPYPKLTLLDMLRAVKEFGCFSAAEVLQSCRDGNGLTGGGVRYDR
jgi:hypothetical protein